MRRVVRVADRLGADDARRAAREVAAELGFSEIDAEAAALAAGELAMNLHRYARRGEIAVEEVEEAGRRGIQLTSRDGGPGIADVDAAMVDGFSTGGGLGGGLGGIRRLMDDFEVATGAWGTLIVARKWTSAR